jgi:hypothetical protein
MTDTTATLISTVISEQTATLIAAVIAAFAGLVAVATSFYSTFHQQNRVGKLRLAEFRRDWIESLREKLASYLALSLQLDICQKKLKGQDPKELLLIDQIEEMQIKLMSEFYYIKLCLNKTETAHRELLEILELMLTEKLEIVQFKLKERGLNLADMADDILKTEWKKLKLEM